MNFVEKERFFELNNNVIVCETGMLKALRGTMVKDILLIYYAALGIYIDIFQFYLKFINNCLSQKNHSLIGSDFCVVCG